MEQNIRGQVISVESDQVQIAVESEQQCHSCGLKDSCSNKVLTVHTSDIDYNASKGDFVKVIYRKLILTSGLLYILPLVAFFLGIGLSAGFLTADNEMIHFLSGTVFLTITLVLIRILGNQFQKKEFRIQVQALK